MVVCAGGLGQMSRVLVFWVSLFSWIPQDRWSWAYRFLGDFHALSIPTSTLQLAVFRWLDLQLHTSIYRVHSHRLAQKGFLWQAFACFPNNKKHSGTEKRVCMWKLCNVLQTLTVPNCKTMLHGQRHWQCWNLSDCALFGQMQLLKHATSIWAKPRDCFLCTNVNALNLRRKRILKYSKCCKWRINLEISFQRKSVKVQG